MVSFADVRPATSANDSVGRVTQIAHYERKGFDASSPGLHLDEAKAVMGGRARLSGVITELRLGNGGTNAPKLANNKRQK